MNNILVMHQNYVSTDVLNSQTKSSELTAAPATNVWDKVRRTKFWRTAGYYVVTSANKGIVLQEVAAVNQTVNIAEGTYATDALFIAAVKTALDSAAGSAVYTVTRDTTTNRIKITSDGAGGAVFRLMLTNVAFTATDLLGYTSAADLTGSLTYTANALRVHTSEWLRWDFGMAVFPQAFAICGTRKDGLKISSTATVTLQGNSTDVWTSPEYTQVIEWNADCMALIDEDGLHTAALRYWRLLIVDKDNSNGYVEISSAFLGGVITTDTGKVQFPLETTYVDYSRTVASEWGTKYSDKRQLSRTFRLQWEFLDKSEVEDLQDFIEAFGLTDCFWIALDPNGVFSNSFQKNVMPCYFDETPTFMLNRPNQMSSVWNIREAV
jgi:hypothetical protein